MSVHSYFGFEFTPVGLNDIRLLTGFLNRYPQTLTGYTFSTLVAWQPYFHYEWVLAEPDILLISCILEPDAQRHLLQPVGVLSPAVAQKLLNAAKQLSYPLKIVGTGSSFLKENASFTQNFIIREDRAVSNYIYDAKTLATLAGRKYAKKRNLLAQASGSYPWSVQKITQDLTDSCFRVIDSILNEENPRVEGMLARELAALKCTLSHFEEFGQQGLLITVDERPVAFSIFEALSPTTVAVHFERALRSYKGLYQVINWETAKVVAEQGFLLINREEDLGDAGLRDAKKSYHPLEIAPSYELTFQNLLLQD